MLTRKECTIPQACTQIFPAEHIAIVIAMYATTTLVHSGTRENRQVLPKENVREIASGKTQAKMEHGTPFRLPPPPPGAGADAWNHPPAPVPSTWHVTVAPVHSALHDLALNGVEVAVARLDRRPKHEQSRRQSAWVQQRDNRLASFSLLTHFERGERRGGKRDIR